MFLSAITIPSIGALIIALIATITDVRTGKIFNWLTLPSILIGMVVRAVFYAMNAPDAPIAGAIAGAINALIGFLVGLFSIGIFKLTIMRKFGGGDIKLMAALGAFVGPAVIFATFIFYCVLFGVYTCSVMLLAVPWRQLWMAYSSKNSAVVNMDKLNEVRKSALPVAPFIAVALLLVVIFEKQTLKFFGI